MHGVSRSPGALAAIRLKNEVGKHIADTPAIPPTSKIVTRVYINAGQPNPSKRGKSFKGKQVEMLDSFRIQFTETMPLFDFVDVGRGNERADQKIRGFAGLEIHHYETDHSRKLSVAAIEPTLPSSIPRRLHGQRLCSNAGRISISYRCI